MATRGRALSRGPASNSSVARLLAENLTAFAVNHVRHPRSMTTMFQTTNGRSSVMHIAPR
jgi:hypothetical protein